MTWTLTDHACRVCLGRVLVQGDRYRCADCGAAGEGSHESICGCGIKVAGRRGGFKCAVNPNPGPGCPAEVLIEFSGSKATGAKKPRRLNTVADPDLF